MFATAGRYSGSGARARASKRKYRGALKGNVGELINAGRTLRAPYDLFLPFSTCPGSVHGRRLYVDSTAEMCFSL